MQKLFPKNQILTFFLILTEKKVIMKSTAYNRSNAKFFVCKFSERLLENLFSNNFSKIGRKNLVHSE